MDRQEAIMLAKKAANQWFCKSFDDDLLQCMEDMNLISQVEGFSLIVLTELMNEIEYAFEDVDK